MSGSLDQQILKNELCHNINQIDKAFTSNVLSDVLPMITNCAAYIRDYPFPSFIMDILHRLATLFQGDNYIKMDQFLNTIRLRIITTIKECTKFLTVALSTEQIVKEIMKVSHSNDYKARSLTLLLLGSFAPIIHENKKVHHLLIESLDCTNQSELISALYATSEFVKYSKNFSRLVVGKIGEMLNKGQHNYSVKINIMNVLTNMEDNIELLSKSTNKTLLTKEARHTRFFKIIARYVRSDECTSSSAFSIANSLIQKESQEISASNSQLYHTLYVIIENHPECSQFIHSWASNLLSRLDSISIQSVPLNFFKLFISTMDDAVNSSPTVCNDFVCRLMNSGLSYWTVYKIARAALQCGKWKNVAYPLLQSVHKMCDSLETNSWIEALIYIAKSQPNSFTASELKCTESNLRDAALILDMLKSLNHGKDQHFGFSNQYIISLASEYNAFKVLMVALNVNFFAFPALRNGSATEECRLNVIHSLKSVVEAFVKASERWTNLYMRSFDAGFQTLKQIDFMLRLNELIVNLISIIIDPASKFVPYSLEKVHLNMTNRKLYDLLSSTNDIICNKIQVFDTSDEPMDIPRPKGDTYFVEKLHLCKNLLLSLCSFPNDLPPYFFIKRWSTKIRLNFHPPPDSEGNLRVSSADLLPIAVEGIIETNNPNSISEVCVILSKNNNPKYDERRLVALEMDERYFKAQFLLKVTKVTKLQISLSFTDSLNKKIWLDDQILSLAVTPMA